MGLTFDQRIQAESKLVASGQFPHLKIGSFEVTSPQDARYNCIAWAANITSLWMWPGAYFPTGKPSDISLSSFIKEFKSRGFTCCVSSKFEQGFEKVAIFANNNNEVTHMARQLNETRWTSKIGRNWDISHELTALRGPQYGEIFQIMKRDLVNGQT